jgi:hypothetical protein
MAIRRTQKRRAARSWPFQVKTKARYRKAKVT